MNVIEKVNAELAEFSSITHEADDRSVTVPPASPQGFTVSLELDEPGYVVFYDGWHQHFEAGREADAVNCFWLGLTPACRLRVRRRGGRAYRWTMQYLHEGRWRFGGVISLLFFRFWRRKEVVVLQNDAIPAAELQAPQDSND